MGAEIPKQFLILNGLPVIMHSINAFLNYFNSIKIVLVLPQAHFDTWKELCEQHNFNREHNLCAGGETRFQSVKNGLKYVENDALVAVHDAVRPLVSTNLIDRCYSQAEVRGNAVPVIALKDSARSITAEGSISLKRDTIRLVQTPQVFQAGELSAAYEQEEDASFTDDASVVEANGMKIHLVEGCGRNIKITTPADMAMAEAMLKQANRG